MTEFTEVPHFPRPQLASRVWFGLCYAGTRGVRIMSAPETGKTAFLTRDLIPLASKGDSVHAVYIPLNRDTANPLGVIIDALEDAVHQASGIAKPGRAAMRTQIKRLEVLGNAIEMGDRPPVEREPATRPALRVHQLCNQLATMVQKPLFLVLDDAQHLATAPDRVALLHTLRAIIDWPSRRDRILFSTNDITATSKLFRDAASPLTGACQHLTFPELGPDFVRHVLQHHRQSTGVVLDEAVMIDAFAALGHRPRPWLMLLATMHFDRLTDPQSILSVMLEDEASRCDWRAKHRALSPLERLIMVSMSRGQAVQTQDARRSFAAAMSRPQILPGSVEDAIQRLMDRGLIRPDRKHGAEPRFMDLAYCTWLKNNHPPQPAIPEHCAVTGFAPA